MNEILPLLYLGELRDAEKTDLLLSVGVRGVVSCCTYLESAVQPIFRTNRSHLSSPRSSSNGTTGFCARNAAKKEVNNGEEQICLRREERQRKEGEEERRTADGRCSSSPWSLCKQEEAVFSENPRSTARSLTTAAATTATTTTTEHGGGGKSRAAREGPNDLCSLSAEESNCRERENGQDEEEEEKEEVMMRFENCGCLDVGETLEDQNMMSSAFESNGSAAVGAFGRSSSNHSIPALTYLRVCVEDVSSEPINLYFEEAAEFIDSFVLRGEAVLVHCKAGVSRSATVVLSYLVGRRSFRLSRAFYHVLSRRKIICPNIGFMEQLCDYEMEVLRRMRRKRGRRRTRCATKTSSFAENENKRSGSPTVTAISGGTFSSPPPGRQSVTTMATMPSIRRRATRTKTDSVVGYSNPLLLSQAEAKENGHSPLRLSIDSSGSRISSLDPLQPNHHEGRASSTLSSRCLSSRNSRPSLHTQQQESSEHCESVPLCTSYEPLCSSSSIPLCSSSSSLPLSLSSSLRLCPSSSLPLCPSSSLPLSSSSSIPLCSTSSLPVLCRQSCEGYATVADFFAENVEHCSARCPGGGLVMSSRASDGHPSVRSFSSPNFTSPLLFGSSSAIDVHSSSVVGHTGLHSSRSPSQHEKPLSAPSSSLCSGRPSQHIQTSCFGSSRQREFQAEGSPRPRKAATAYHDATYNGPSYEVAFASLKTDAAEGAGDPPSPSDSLAEDEEDAHDDDDDSLSMGQPSVCIYKYIEWYTTDAASRPGVPDIEPG